MILYKKITHPSRPVLRSAFLVLCMLKGRREFCVMGLESFEISNPGSWCLRPPYIICRGSDPIDDLKFLVCFLWNVQKNIHSVTVGLSVCEWLGNPNFAMLFHQGYSPFISPGQIAVHPYWFSWRCWKRTFQSGREFVVSRKMLCSEFEDKQRQREVER